MEAAQRLYKNCAISVQLPCNLSAVAVQSPQPLHGNHTEPMRLPCRGCAEMVRWPCSAGFCFWARGIRAVPVQGLCKKDATFDMSTVIRTKISQPPPASARRPHRKGDRGSMRFCLWVCGLCAGPVQGLRNATYDMSTVIRTKISQAASCLHTEAAQKGG